MTNPSSHTTDTPQRAIHRYFRGHETGDPEVMRRAFHPHARLQWRKEGALEVTGLDTYLTWLPGKPATDEDRRVREVTHLHESGGVAVAEVVLDYPDVRFVDYLTMVSSESGWQITNKAFVAYPKGAE